MMMFWALLYINSLYLDGLEMLTRRISSCGVTKRKGLRWLTVILSLIFTCSWSYAGTLCELVTFQTRFQLHYRQKNGCQNKIGVLLLLYLLFMFFFYCCLQMLPHLGTPLQILGWDGWDQGSGSQAITSKRCAVEATRMHEVTHQRDIHLPTNKINTWMIMDV